MKIKVNGKVFTIKKEDDKRLKIKKGLDGFDLLYFQEWITKGIKTGQSKDYREDIPFISKLSRGKLIGCFPSEVSEDYIILIYDTIKSI